jgi:hypothetical protein
MTRKHQKPLEQEGTCKDQIFFEKAYLPHTASHCELQTARLAHTTEQKALTIEKIS